MKITKEDITCTLNGVVISGYVDGGIVNVPGTMTLSEDEEFRKLVSLADTCGLIYITVGIDCDMKSNLMRKLAESGKFVIRKQIKAPEHKQEEPKTFGPRNRWGKLK